MGASTRTTQDYGTKETMSRLLPTVLIVVAGILLVLAGDPCYEPFGSANEHDVCKAYFTRWGFDPVEKTCKDFVYGGCGANGNNFNSKDECEDKCVRNKTDL